MTRPTMQDARQILRETAIIAGCALFILYIAIPVAADVFRAAYRSAFG